MNKIFYISISFIFLSGCAKIFSAPSANWPWKSGSPCKSTCTTSEALTAFNDASQFCRAVQNYYENGGQRTNNAKLAIGGIGTLAGTVVAPVSTGSAATAWSGLSGAANAFQVSIDDAFSTNIAIKRRNAVQTVFSENSTKIVNEENNDKKVQLAINMAAECAMSSAVADQEAMKALME